MCKHFFMVWYGMEGREEKDKKKEKTWGVKMKRSREEQIQFDLLLESVARTVPV